MRLLSIVRSSVPFCHIFVSFSADLSGVFCSILFYFIQILIRYVSLSSILLRSKLSNSVIFDLCSVLYHVLLYYFCLITFYDLLCSILVWSDLLCFFSLCSYLFCLISFKSVLSFYCCRQVFWYNLSCPVLFSYILHLFLNCHVLFCFV